MPEKNTPEISQLLEQSYTLVSSDIPQAKALAEQALSLSMPYSLEHAQASVLLGICLIKEEQYIAGLEMLLQATHRFGQYEDEWLAIAYYNMGVTYHQLNLFTEATEAHQMQYDVAKKINSKIWMASALRRIGADHDHLGQPQRALEYYDKSLELYQSVEESGGMAGVYNNMSIAHYALKDYERALEFGLKGLPLFEEVGHLGGLAQIHGNIALAASALGQFDEAISHANKNLDYAKKRGHKSGLILAYLRLTTIYREMGQNDRSIASLNQALALVEDADPHTAVEAHHEAFKYYEQSGDLEKALFHHKQYHTLKTEQLEDAMTSRYEAIAIIHNIKQLQAEAELQRGLREQDRRYFEKLHAMKDELVSTASHDLKNPLSSIMTVLYLLKRHKKIDDSYGEQLLERIDDSIMQMRDLITNLLDLAQLETGKSLILRVTDIITFARQISDEYKLLAGSKGVIFHFTSNVNEQYLSIDVLMFRRVLVNLLSNALKFTPEGGMISFNLEKHDERMFITIEDSGIGIPTDDQPHVFERFYRVNNVQHQAIEGTGLGLPICKTIVEQHGGTITVESAENVGTKFTIQLPILES